MTTFATVKLTLALCGIALFGAGIRFEVPALRWAGLGCVAVAWVLRFRKMPGQRDGGSRA